MRISVYLFHCLLVTRECASGAMLLTLSLYTCTLRLMNYAEILWQNYNQNDVQFSSSLDWHNEFAHNLLKTGDQNWRSIPNILCFDLLNLSHITTIYKIQACGTSYFIEEKLLTESCSVLTHAHIHTCTYRYTELQIMAALLNDKATSVAVFWFYIIKLECN